MEKSQKSAPHKIKAVVTDLDGTLLRSADSSVSYRDLESLKYLGENGIVRIAATGRAIASVKRAFPAEFPLDYLVFSNGNGTMDLSKNELFASHHLPRTDVRHIVRKLCSFGADFHVRGIVPQCHTFLYKRQSKFNSDFEHLLERYSEDCTELTDETQLGEASRVICFSEDAQDVVRIGALFPDFDIIRATSPINHKTIWVEIYPRGINKGTAVAALCGKLGIDSSEIAGLGNDYNDIHFLDLVGFPYLVSNAPNELKQRYTALLMSNNESAFTEMLLNLKIL